MLTSSPDTSSSSAFDAAGLLLACLYCLYQVLYSACIDALGGE